MQDRLTELEIKFMEQEQTLEALSEQVYLQQKEIFKLTQHIQILSERLKTLAVSPLASQAEETPPPHY
ncbi:SlyX family protein [uncultured Thiothrix sp.]|jgi:SlyX protein|uniref:SlyX family protein n=1 Tax=uncultured Thiothrix sp. TaxID=223185 RepID=UPI002606EF2A|nr:SlyX family protein [uncultured Thiothrix sp.]HMT94754.1 SlyX family protein [Thiolinea sp.]